MITDKVRIAYIHNIGSNALKIVVSLSNTLKELSITPQHPQNPFVKEIGSIPNSVKILNLLHKFNHRLSKGIIPDSIKRIRFL
ncbi:hypothetical protein RB653_001043 [Dictyostelium firmibasis]|uniref:Uncharacterized protein n=1 Tax=Dictyostelium firmibasis TaxID=79012 RepID=A0AAN7YWC7_9MYCE